MEAPSGVGRAVSAPRWGGAGVFAGVSMYTAHDINFTIVGYAWIAIWYCFAVFEMVYVKKVVDTVQMTTWSRTYYQARAARAALGAP